MLVGVLILYAAGALWLWFLLKLTLSKILMMAVLPFIPGDLLKAFLATSISASLLPKKSYNGEIDR